MNKNPNSFLRSHKALLSTSYDASNTFDSDDNNMFELFYSIHNNLDKIREKPLDFTQPNIPDYSLLNFAVKVGKTEVISILLENKAHPLKYDSTGINPFDRALLKKAASSIFHNFKVEDLGAENLEKLEEIYVPDRWEYSIKKSIDARNYDEEVKR